MNAPLALLLTDLVDSAALASRLGDRLMTALWASHDRLARDLLRHWRGREIDKTDGFLLLFDQAGDALAYALAYHRALAGLPAPMLARCGLHVGAVSLRETPAGDVALGAKPLEVDGVAKLLAARVMATALGGQTLLTASALQAVGPLDAAMHRLLAHGHWRFKGMPEPVALYEVGEPGTAHAPFAAPPDGDKAYRVVAHPAAGAAGAAEALDGDAQDALWLPVRAIRHSLPAERDAFVGRRSALGDLARRFDAGARLVSLLGIGGCGKTRLAAHFGWSNLGDFPGGVWFCDLASARETDGLLHAVAQGLDVPLGKDDPLAQLGHAIAGRGPCLVILDNFEQVARHAEATLGRWLERAAQARFLVTTREVLGIAGEEAVALAPMLPTDAEALFRRRAAAAKRDFNPSPDDDAAIAPLVRLLDGLPLAIELAAARVRSLAPRAMLARMRERFKLLTSSGHRLDRQATLRAAFDWSWDLLTPADKAALAQLSVFEGGFTLEAAEGVIALEHLSHPPWTMDTVHSLVDKSFVRALEDERFDLLMSVQAYADEHLRSDGRYAGSGPAALLSAQARHGAWFAALGPQRAVEHGCIELDNLVAAGRRAILADAPALACGALVGAWAALALQGPYQTGVDLAQAVCGMPSLARTHAAQAQATLGAALEAAGRQAEARASYERALGHFAPGAGGVCEIEVSVSLGALMARAGQIGAARRIQTQALALARERGQPSLECTALIGMGNVEFEQGRMDEAQVHYEAALALARQIGHRRWQCSVLGNLGNLHASCGRMDPARTLSEEALRIARDLGDRRREGTALSNLGMDHLTHGRLDEAGQACAAALQVARDLGHARLECMVLCNLGLVRDAEGDLVQALTHLQAALEMAQRMGDRRAQGQVLGYLGGSHARNGELVLARACLDSGEAALRAVADRLSLGILLCQRAECEWRDAKPEPAKAAFSVADQIATENGVGAASELGVALRRLRAMFETAEG